MNTDEKALPPALAALRHTRNRAADDALVAAFAHLDAAEQALALSILLERGRDAALAGIVALYGNSAEFGDGAEPLRQLLCEHAEALSAGARICMSDERFEVRRAAVDLIRTARSGKLAYLLAEGLRHSCRKTVQLAAEALAELAEHAVSKMEMATARAPQARTGLTYLTTALHTALASWPVHLRPEVTGAVALLAGPLEDAILTAADDPRSSVARAFGNLIAGSQDPRLAGLCLRGLRSQSLRVAAGNLLAEARSPEFRSALVRDAWLLVDGEVRKSCARTRGFACLRDDGDVFAEAQAGRARAAVRLAAAGTGRAQPRAELLRRLSIGTHAETARAAMWALIDDRSDEATEVLNGLSARSDVPLREIVRLELRRRTCGAFAVRGARQPIGDFIAPNATAPRNAFDPYWHAFDTLPEASRVSIGRTVLAGEPEFAALMRAAWTNGGDAERSRFLKIVQALGLSTAFEQEIYAAARGNSSHVRSLAVRLLADLNTAASRRLLRAALDDADDRVQANAIESIERLGISAEAPRMQEKLNASASRVRANAVKALIHLGLREGAGTLIEMLASDTASDRLSALWVVERMRLHHMLARIERIVDGDPDERVRTRARRLLRLLREQRSVPVASAAMEGKR